VSSSHEITWSGAVAISASFNSQAAPVGIRGTAGVVGVPGAVGIVDRVQIEFVDAEVAEIFRVDGGRDENKETGEQEIHEAPHGCAFSLVLSRGKRQGRVDLLSDVTSVPWSAGANKGGSVCAAPETAREGEKRGSMIDSVLSKRSHDKAVGISMAHVGKSPASYLVSPSVQVNYHREKRILQPNY
jgi:hypothetical protein